MTSPDRMNGDGEAAGEAEDSSVAGAIDSNSAKMGTGAVREDPGMVRSTMDAGPPAEALHPHVRTYWRAAYAIRFGVYTVFAIVVALPAAASFRPSLLLPTAVGLAILGGVAMIAAAVVPGLRYARFRFEVGRDLLRVTDGVLVRREVVIPVDRMQHIDLNEGLMERAFGLASLAVFTAGGTGATFRLPGLAPERAKELRRLILSAKEEPPNAIHSQRELSRE